jgi:hypothetical protein
MGVSEQRFVEVYLSAFLIEFYGREHGCKDPVFMDPVVLTLYGVDASDVPSICSILTYYHSVYFCIDSLVPTSAS